MDNLIGIVNNPQFDMGVFSVGKAIHIVGRLGGRGFDRDCIIQKASPLSLKVVFIDNDSCVDDTDISITEIVNQDIRIRLLKEDK